MILIASAFGTFMLFLLAGLGALAFTALFDRSLGKERALLVYVLGLVALTWLLGRPDPIKGGAAARSLARGNQRIADALARRDIQGDPLARPALARQLDARNPFQKYSDTRPLPPIELALPPWLALPTELPPTVPGPAPGARHLLRGELPTLKTGDGSTIAAVPEATFEDYTVGPDDVYDWIFDLGRKVYIYILAINDGGTWVEEKDPRFFELKWRLAAAEPEWEKLQVRWAQVGSAETAAKRLEPTAVLAARRTNVSTTPADRFPAWYLRRTVENHYVEALRAEKLKDPGPSSDVGRLVRVADRMAEVGESGKENKEGWRKAAVLLEHALQAARASAPAGLRAEILAKLVGAYRALRDEEALLRALSEYAQTSPGRPEPWLWLGQVHLDNLMLAPEAQQYFGAALERDPRSAQARIGEGDAYTMLGDHARALEAYGRAGTGYEARVRLAEARLRLGQLEAAEREADQALQQQPSGARALVARGAIQYARGDVQAARGTFERAVQAGGEEGLRHRAEAAYDLGLCCWRLGQGDAALAAFDAADQALRHGSDPARYADEAVSPSFGRALVALAAGNDGGFRESLQSARQEAPRVAYHEMLVGMLGSRAENDATAVRAFERALRLATSYPELDGWLARTKLRLGQQALAAGTPISEAAQDFEAAVAFAVRASQTETRRDPKAVAMVLREAWIRLQAEHLPARIRFEAARGVVEGVLSRVDREQPGALAIRGYCNYRLADYDQCIRDLQQVLDTVPDQPGPWLAWRTYAGRTLEAVKHWRSLEEKTIAFEAGRLPEEWKTDEAGGVKVGVDEDGSVRFTEAAKADGNLEAPNVVLKNEKLVTAGSFEEVRLLLRIPTRDARGDAVNTITFGVQIQRKSGRSGLSRQPGLGIFYDKGKIAVRVGTGRDEMFKDGQIHRLVPETPWPGDGFVEVRIVREDGQDGEMAVYLDADLTDGVAGQEVFRDLVSGFKEGTRGEAELWIGGYSTQLQTFDVTVKEIRVIRRQGP